MGKMRACEDAGFCGVHVWQKVKCTNHTTNPNPMVLKNSKIPTKQTTQMLNIPLRWRSISPAIYMYECCTFINNITFDYSRWYFLQLANTNCSGNTVDEINIRFPVVIDWLSSCSENSHPLHTKFEPNTSPAFFFNYSVHSVVHCVHITRVICKFSLHTIV